MCGILAIYQFGSNGPVDKELLIRMTNTMAHRGPDGMGYWVSNKENIGLGHRRLAIIDLSSAGNQPMTNETGSIWVTYNGEIYNFKELRQELESKGHLFQSHTDTEVLIHAYEEWGEECLNRFNGIWAFALWDESDRKLFVSRDRFGVKPLVYYYNKNFFICASEIKTLLINPDIPREIHPLALHHYLSLMNIPAPLTIYRGIFKLRPGHYLIVRDGEVIEKKWWKLKLGQLDSNPEERILEKLEELLSDSIKLRLVSDVPIGAFLSGGVDSSLITAIASRHLVKGGFKTFSVTFKGDNQYDESRYSHLVAQQTGTDHTEIDIQVDFLEILPDVVRHFDEPFAISSALAVYVMARETSRYVKVVLTGDGGDEVFAGYPWRHTQIDHLLNLISHLPIHPIRKLNAKIPACVVKWRLPKWLNRLYHLGIILTKPDSFLREWEYQQALYTFNEEEKFTLYTPEWADHLKNTPNFSSTDQFLASFWPDTSPHPLAKRLYFDLHTTLSDEMLSKVDRATMAWGIEARNPFLDYRLVEYTLTLPGQLMAEGKNGKLLLKKLGRRFLPYEVIDRPKQGFNVPLERWLRGKLPPIFFKALSPERIRSSGIFRDEVIWEIIKRHQMDMRINLSNSIFTLAWFELWMNNG